jgi:hypothetical protein
VKGVEPPVRIPAQRAPVRDDQVLITGDVAAELLVATADLDARAQAPREIRYTTRYFTALHRVQGVPLHEVLAAAVINTDARHKMGELNMVVLAVSEDGYQVVLSWAEIDPDFGDCAALLATRYDGAFLTRPTLVLPRDNRASRYVRRLARLCLRSMAPVC